MPSSPRTETVLLDRLVKALGELPQVQQVRAGRARSVRGKSASHDALVNLRLAGKPLVLVIEAKKSLYPRDARQALWQLQVLDRHAPESKGSERLPMLIAESISPGAKEYMRAERVGYFDGGGSLYLPAKGAYLYIEKPQTQAAARVLRSLYTGRRAQVLHALLNEPGAWFSVKGLAGQAQVSPATASQVLIELERLEWAESRGRGPSKERHLKEPAALLDAWANQVATARPAPLRRFFVPSLRGDALADRIAQVLAFQGAEYALTHEIAAQRYAPFLSSVSQVRCRLIPGGAADQALAILGARSVTEGANFSIIDAKSPGELLFRQKLGEARLASPVQVYLDLLRGEGRSKDMAAHLRREKIGF
jgi:hypothetical protein